MCTLGESSAWDYWCARPILQTDFAWSTRMSWERFLTDSYIHAKWISCRWWGNLYFFNGGGSHTILCLCERKALCVCVCVGIHTHTYTHKRKALCVCVCVVLCYFLGLYEARSGCHTTYMQAETAVTLDILRFSVLLAALSEKKIQAAFHICECRGLLPFQGFDAFRKMGWRQ